MYLFERILRAIRGWFRRKPIQEVRNYPFDIKADTLYALKKIADQVDRTPEEIAGIFLEYGAIDWDLQEENREKWYRLSLREQDVAALMCLGYTNRQIGAKLHISPGTVKKHVEHIMAKLDIHRRDELRLQFKGWDFRKWDR